MIPRVVCDTMVYYQWAALGRQKLHGIHAAVLEDRLKLCLSTDLVSEVRDLLARPAIRAKSPSLTDERISAFLNALLAKSDFYADPPRVFTLPNHPKDDHVFNLAITAQADRLVTWEDRILKLQDVKSADGQRLRAYVPGLHILTPIELSNQLKAPDG